MVRPKKYLGQHFLTDPGIAKRIVDALETGEGDTVVEVGPGTGILTGFLLDRKINLIPVEIDPESADFLIRQWPVLEGKLVEGDILSLDLQSVSKGTFHVIGNFPYNISSQIFFKILEHRSGIGKVVCMVQKEVADRITAPPGSKTYGILSVLVQAFFRTSSLFTVRPGSFRPPPKVVSGVIMLERNGTAHLPCDETLFFRVVKTTFNQRRKMIRNSIRPILLHLEGDFELLDKRPEQLNVHQFTELTRWVESQLNGGLTRPSMKY
jgi:16S rRNA (adenine1518-N6/adenine1519-N6)-dimethyltransferase